MPFIKRFYIIRYPKLFYIQQDFWSHVYGILGVIGLAITIIFTYSAYKNVGSESAKIINAISFSLITITIAFVFVSAYYVRKLSMNRVELEETRIIKEKLRKQFLLNRYQSEAFHNITHYHRNINARLYQFFENPDGYTGEDMKELANRFDEYMIILGIVMI